VKLRTVVVHANAAIAVLRHGDTKTDVAPPRPEVVFSVPADEDLVVEATSSDGRTARARLTRDAAALSLAFETKPRSVPVVARPPPAPASAPIATDDGLAPSPYRRKK
jgi:hypothetical protein